MLEGPDSRPLAFLFADLRGYSAIVETRGERQAADLLIRYRDLVRLGVAEHKGAEIKTEGDSFYVVFQTAAAAVECALRIQREAHEASIAVGIGIDAGETTPVQGGFVGSAVNTAARLCSLAAPGQVLVTGTVRHLLRTHPDLTFAPGGRRRLKGMREAVHVFRAQTGVSATRNLSLPRKGLALLGVLVLIVSGFLAARLVHGASSQPHHKSPATVTPPNMAVGQLHYQALLDTSGSDFIDRYSLGPAPDNAVTFQNGSIVFDLRRPKRTDGNPGVIEALSVRMPPENRYIADTELTTAVRYYAGTFAWVVRVGDGAKVGDYAVMIMSQPGGVMVKFMYIDEATLLTNPESFGGLLAQATNPEPFGELLAPATLFRIAPSQPLRVSVLVDPPRFVVYLNNQPTMDVCDARPGRVLPESGVKLVATERDVPGPSFRITAVRIYGLPDSPVPPHSQCGG